MTQFFITLVGLHIKTKKEKEKKEIGLHIWPIPDLGRHIKTKKEKIKRKTGQHMLPKKEEEKKGEKKGLWGKTYHHHPICVTKLEGPVTKLEGVFSLEKWLREILLVWNDFLTYI